MPRTQHRDASLPGTSGAFRQLVCAAMLLASMVFLQSQCSSEATNFVASVRLRGRHPTARTPRRFFEKLTPKYWMRETFVCNFLDENLPQARPKALLKVLEIEPSDAKYWQYLKPLEPKWYIDECFAVGSDIDDLEDGTLRGMKDAANGIGAKCSFIAWRKPHWPFGVEKASIDMMLLSDGAITRLGPRLENAMQHARAALKKSGRFYFIVNEEDEEALGGRMELEFDGTSIMDQYGFEIVTSKRDHDLAVGYMKQRGAAGPGAAGGRGPLRPTRGRAY